MTTSAAEASRLPTTKEAPPAARPAECSGTDRPFGIAGVGGSPSRLLRREAAQSRFAICKGSRMPWRAHHARSSPVLCKNHDARCTTVR